MTKVSDDNGRKPIKDKLKEEVLLFIQQQGVRKISVGELVKYVNTSKGTFYLFYTSKELLLFDTIIDYRKKLEKEFFSAINKHADNTTIDTSTDIISGLLVNNRPYFVSVFVNSDVKYLGREFPQKVFSQHVDDDVMLVSEVLKFISESKSIDTKVFAGTLRAVFLATLNEETTGTDIHNEVFKFIVRGIVKQLLRD